MDKLFYILDIPLHNTLWKNGHWNIFVLLCSKSCCYLKSYLDNQDPAWIIWKLSGQSKSFWPKPVLNPLCTLSAAAFHEIRILLSTSCHLMNSYVQFWTISFLVVGLAKRCGGSVSRMSLCRTYCLAISSSKDTMEPLLAIIIHNHLVSDTYNVFLNFGQDSWMPQIRMWL